MKVSVYRVGVVGKFLSQFWTVEDHKVNALAFHTARMLSNTANAYNTDPFNLSVVSKDTNARLLQVTKI